MDRYGYVPYAQPLKCAYDFQPRQFEFHNDYDILAVGTTDGKVALVDWSKKLTVLGETKFESKGNVENNDDANRSILALSWLNNQDNCLLAASSTGATCLYDVNVDQRESFDEEKPGAWKCFRRPYRKGKKQGTVLSSNVVQHYRFEDQVDQTNMEYFRLRYDFGRLTDDLTSIHCNCTDELMVASGYTSDVKIYDLETAKLARTFAGIHEDHINITRFANNLPQILLTCSFDSSIKLWDNRVNQNKPIITLNSDAGNVMVCFSPNDMYFLVSAVDNQVSQYTTVDGRLHLKYDIPPTNCDSNYTRSYYSNGGDLIVSGSSNQDTIHICSTLTGKNISTVKLYEGRKAPSLYVQSLRANPKIHNRCCVLVFYRSTEYPYEMVDIDMNRDFDGNYMETPFSLAAVSEFSNDMSNLISNSEYADVELVSNDKKSIYCHSVILRARWSWFMKTDVERKTNNNEMLNNNISFDHSINNTDDSMNLDDSIHQTFSMKPPLAPLSDNNSIHLSPNNVFTSSPIHHYNGVSPHVNIMNHSPSLTVSPSYESLYSLKGVSRSNSLHDISVSSLPKSPSQLIYQLDWSIESDDDDDDDDNDLPELKSTIEVDINQATLDEIPHIVSKPSLLVDDIGSGGLDDEYFDSDDDMNLLNEDSLDISQPNIRLRLEFADLNYSELYIVIYFLYTARLHKSITFQIASQLYAKTSRKQYSLHRLGQMIEQYIRDQLSLTNCVEIFRFAVNNRARRLLSFCEDYVARQLHYYAERYKSLSQVFGNRGYERIKRRFESGRVDVSANNPYLLARSAHDSVLVRRKVYIIGGYHNRGTQTLHQIPVYDINSKTWVILKATGDTPDSLCFHSANYVNSEKYGECIICFGGDAANATHNGVLILKLKEMHWEKMKTKGRVIPTARKRHAAVIIGNELWVYGGRDRTTVKGDIYVLNINSGVWKYLAIDGDIPQPRFGHTLTHIKSSNKIVIIGGFTPMGVIGLDIIEFDIVRKCFSVPNVSGNGSFIEDQTPKPRCRHSCAYLKHRSEEYLILFGGSTSLNFVSNENEAHLQDTWLLNVNTWSWVPVNSTKIPSRRSTHSCWVYIDNNDVHRPVIWGGADSQAFPRDMMELNVETLQWDYVNMYVAGTQREPPVPIAYPMLALQAKTMLVTDVLSEIPIKMPNLNEIDDDSNKLNKMIQDNTALIPPSNNINMIPSYMSRIFVDGYCIVISKAILAARSLDYFKLMFSSNFVEAEKNCVIMEDIKLSTFLFIVYFLYTGDIEYEMLQNFNTTNGTKFGYGLKRSKSVPANVNMRIVLNTSSPGRNALARSVSITGLDEQKLNDNDNEQYILKNFHHINITPSELAKRALQNILKEAYQMKGDIYDGKVTCDPSAILIAAKRLGLNSLCNVIEMALSKQISISNVFPLLHFSYYHRLDTLMNTCIMYALVHHVQLLSPSSANSFHDIAPDYLEEDLKILLQKHYLRLFQFRHEQESS